MQNKQHKLYNIPTTVVGAPTLWVYLCVGIGARCSVCTHTYRMSRSFPRSAIFIYFPDVFVVRCRDFVSGFWLNTFKVFFPNSRRTYNIRTNVQFPGVCCFWQKAFEINSLKIHIQLSISRAVSNFFLI